MSPPHIQYHPADWDSSVPQFHRPPDSHAQQQRYTRPGYANQWVRKRCQDVTPCITSQEM